MLEAGAGRLVPPDEKAGFDNAIEFDPDQDGEDDDEDDGEFRLSSSTLPSFLSFDARRSSSNLPLSLEQPR